jgi:hypothetical protein
MKQEQLLIKFRDLNMKKKIFFIIILLALSYNQNILHAQIFHVGFKGEPFILFSDIGHETESKFYTTSIFLIGGIKLSSKFYLEVQPGITLSEERFNGIGTCLSSKYFLREEKEYVTIGIVMLSNRGGSSHSRIIDEKKFILGSLGTGTFLSKSIFVQISYQFPLSNSKYGRTIIGNPYDPNLNTYNELRLIGLLKLALGLSFNL